MIRRRFVPAVIALIAALALSGCHEAFCGDEQDFDYAFGIVGGIYTCVQVPEEQTPYAQIRMDHDPVLAGDRVIFDGLASTPARPGGEIDRYAWDLDGDGRFDDDFGARIERTFDRAGEFPVGLRTTDSDGEHGRAGLLIGVLDPNRVQNPVAVLDVDRPFVTAGDTVTFDPSRSHDPDGRIVRYEWNLEGVGYTRANDDPSPEQYVYPEPGTYTARLRVRDDQRLTSLAERTITVVPSAGGVQAAFTIDPNPAPPDQTVTFDASSSTGPIATYEWDLDGFGGFDETTTTPTTTHLYQGEVFPGDTRDIRLRVANADRTAISTATHELAFGEPSTPGGSAAQASRRFSARLDGTTFGRHRGVARRSGRRLSIKRRVLVGRMRGRLLGRGGGADPLARYLRAGWLARVTMTARLGSPLVKLRGTALATFEQAPGGTCLRLRLRARGRRRTGTLVALGGTGGGATLTARASFRWRFTRRGAVILSGRIRDGTGPGRPPSRACARLGKLRP